MRRLSAVASALVLLSACSGTSTSGSSDPVKQVKDGLLRRMPSGSSLLMVSVGGEGSGRVSSPDVALTWVTDSTFEKSDVTGAYWAFVPEGTPVTLTATAMGPSTFTGWFGGSCSGNGTCQVTLGSNVDVGAVFDQPGADITKANLSVATTGHGAGTVTGPGISCVSGSRTGCSAVVDVTRPPLTVTLHAQPDAASIFQGWSGSCGGTGDCTVTMDSARTAYAAFAPRTLTVRVLVDGGGTVSGPNGFSCSSPAGCDLLVPNTTPAQMVMLTVSPLATFFGWSAQCTGSTQSCILTVDDNKSVVATWGAMLNHMASLGSGDIVVFADSNTDHGAGFSMTESCTICHFPNLVTQHARQCDLCHGGDRPPALALVGNWNKSCSAGACHASIHTVSTGSDHFRMWQNSSAACDRCHDTQGGTFPGPGDNCSRCHNPTHTVGAVGDRTPPTTTSNAQANYLTASTIHLSATDVLGPTDTGVSGVSVTWYSLDGREWILGTDVPVSVPATGSRAHSLQFYSVDHALNAEALTSVSFTAQAAADTTPPTTTSSFNPAAGAVFTAVQPVTLSATDSGSGVRTTYYRIDAGAWAPGTSFTVADGLHTFSYYSVDVANNTETIRASNQFRIDTIAPVTTCNAVAGTTYSGSQTFTLAPSDAGSGVAGTWYRLDGAPAFTMGTAVAVAAPASGSASHTISWYSRDTAGNQEATRSVTFNVQAPSTDATPPVTTSTFNPTAGATFKASQPVTLTATDVGSGVRTTYYRIDAGAWTAGTTFSVTGDGLHTFGYYSVDNAGNAETARTSNQFRIDTVAPVTTSSAVAGTTYSGPQTFTLTATDAGSGVLSTWYRLDGAAVFTSGTSIAVAAPASGSASHTLSWYSIDRASNQEVTKSVTFSVAAVVGPPPTVTLSFRTNASFGGWSYVTWEVHDGAGNVVNDVSGNPCTWWNDDPGHPSSMWIDYVVPAGVSYTMYGAWGPMPDGPDSDTGTRAVTAAEAAPGATITWWWQ